MEQESSKVEVQENDQEIIDQQDQSEEQGAQEILV